MRKKKLKVILFFVLFGIVLNRPYNFIQFVLDQNERGVNVLAYHHIVPDEEKKNMWKNNLDVMKVSLFEEHMQYLYQNGYHTLTLDELYQWKVKDVEIPEKSVVLTFDDGYTSVLEHVQPILEKYDFCASVFIIGSATPDFTTEYEAGELHYVGLDQIKEENETLDFYSHGYALHTMTENNKTILENMTEDDLKEDIESQANITDTSYLAYPWGKENEQLFDTMKDQDVKLAFDYGNLKSITKESNNYNLPRWPMFSITTKKDVSNILSK